MELHWLLRKEGCKAKGLWLIQFGFLASSVFCICCQPCKLYFAFVASPVICVRFCCQLCILYLLPAIFCSLISLGRLSPDRVREGRKECHHIIKTSIPPDGTPPGAVGSRDTQHWSWWYGAQICRTADISDQFDCLSTIEKPQFAWMDQSGRIIASQWNPTWLFSMRVTPHLLTMTKIELHLLCVRWFKKRHKLNV